MDDLPAIGIQKPRKNAEICAFVPVLDNDAAIAASNSRCKSFLLRIAEDFWMNEARVRDID
jgi:hypothetical protein